MAIVKFKTFQKKRINWYYAWSYVSQEPAHHPHVWTIDAKQGSQEFHGVSLGSFLVGVPEGEPQVRTPKLSEDAVGDLGAVQVFVDHLRGAVAAVAAGIAGRARGVAVVRTPGFAGRAGRVAVVGGPAKPVFDERNGGAAWSDAGLEKDFSALSGPGSSEEMAYLYYFKPSWTMDVKSVFYGYIDGRLWPSAP